MGSRWVASLKRKILFKSTASGSLSQPYVRNRERAVASECMNERVDERVDVEEEEQEEEEAEEEEEGE